MQSAIFSTPRFQFGARDAGEPWATTITLAFSAADSRCNHLTGHFHLTNRDNVDFRHSFGIYAYDVDRFLTTLDSLHNSLEGVAELSDEYDHTNRIVVSVADAAKGRLVVAGEMTPPADHNVSPVHLGDILSFAGVRFQFDGFELDQSFLPTFARDVRSFFTEADVDTSMYH